MNKIIIIGQGVTALPHSKLREAVSLARGVVTEYNINAMFEEGSLVLREPVGGCNNYLPFLEAMREYILPDVTLMSPEYSGETEDNGWCVIYAKHDASTESSDDNLSPIEKLNCISSLCPQCGGITSTFRHVNAKAWCQACGNVVYKEGEER